MASYDKNTKTNNSNNTTGAFLGGAAFGTILGIVLGLVIAPNNGKENRKKLKELSTKTLTVANHMLDESQKTISPLVAEMKPKIKEAGKSVKPVIKSAQAIMQLAEPELEEIVKRIKKGSKNAAERRFFRGDF